MYPEVKYEEFETSKYIKSILEANNITFTEGWAENDIGPPFGKTGIVAEVGTGASPCVALRADFDALPIEELVDLPFKSQNKGFMHACGHDSHATMLLGAAILLKQYEDQLQGTVRFIFQPAEEGGAGALMMLREGVLSKYPPVDRIFAFHIDPKSPTGTVTSRPGPIWGGAGGFFIKFTGKGGHAARHHLTIDPITAGMALIRGIYDIYSRELYFQQDTAGAISITYIKTSTSAPNIVPENITIAGSFRGLKLDTLKLIKRRIKEVAKRVAAAYHCTVEFGTPNLREGLCPSVENDLELFKFYEQIVAEGARDNKVVITEPEMVSEDYAYFANEVPSVFSFLGIGSGSEIVDHPPTNIGLHNAKFSLDERILPIGAALHTHIALQNLDDLNNLSSLEVLPLYKDEL